MTRTSSHGDLRLIKAGKELMINKGAASLNIRELTEMADVNLGMFSYYFKNKNNFINIVLNEIYDDFLLELDLNQKIPALEKLKKQLLILGKFARNNRKLILSLINDVLGQEEVVQNFVKTKMKQHFVILSKTLIKCQKEKLIIELPLPLLLTQIVASIGISNLIPELLFRLNIEQVFKKSLSNVTSALSTDKAIEQRVDLILKGIII